jgi:hypothetical protein
VVRQPEGGHEPEAARWGSRVRISTLRSGPAGPDFGSALAEVELPSLAGGRLDLGLAVPAPRLGATCLLRAGHGSSFDLDRAARLAGGTAGRLDIVLAAGNRRRIAR